jgi:5'-phosphate synthase pdxT subunit
LVDEPTGFLIPKNNKAFSMTGQKIVNVGVLSLQGSYHEHIKHLQELFRQLNNDLKYSSKFKFFVKEIKTVDDLKDIQGLIFPGGESSTMSILLQRTGLLEPIRELVQIKKTPVWGTCAGLILLSNEIINTKIDLGDLKYKSIGGLNVQVQRNSFGRQVDSFSEKFKLENFGDELKNTEFECVFIRAPVIQKIISPNKKNSNVEYDLVNGIVYGVQLVENFTAPEVLLTIEHNDHKMIVAVRQENILGTSFHPELVVDDYTFHKWFIDEFVLKSI